MRVVDTSEFFFFDGREDVVAIEKGDGSAGTGSGDAENVHDSEFPRLRSMRLFVG